ncbi:hypothetical protein LUZ60_015164 [Juncus effusus]|nr:hypothetical protein LUZ60_015164 [Juncus effusus]
MASSSPLLSLLTLIILTLTVTLTLAEKKTYIIQVDPLSKPTIFPSPSHWYASTTFSSDSGETISPLHVYDTVFHGFSASLDASQASSLRLNPSVLAVYEDRVRQLHTTRSPQFLGLRTQLGLWSFSDYGSDVVVGVLDTGVWPERRSFSDRNLPPVPATWRGGCDTGPGFSSSACNKKLVGARFFSKGHSAKYGTDAVAGNSSVEFMSPRDADGHGTHTASTAAGSISFKASFSGYASGVAKGVAPKARIAAYKVCWKNSGCLDSDILAGFDKAVSDGVNVISLSIGGGDGVASPYYLDPIALGSYVANSKGIFVATSAGNDGPSLMSVTNLAPWLTTVGAGTIDRNFPAEISLGDGRKFNGVSLYSGRDLGDKMLQIVYPGKTGGLSASLCMENSLDPKLVRGKIIICDRGSSPRVAKGFVVKEAGGVGMILANGVSNGEGLVGDAHVLPACAVGANEGNLIKSYITSSTNPTAIIRFKGTIVGVKPAPVVASFSARGPNGLSPEILKPDLIAPGVNILAAWTDAIGPTGLETDVRKTEFNILSGTSMACPHVSGAAALLKSAHPDWSPAMMRSAMMTTANVVDNSRGQLKDEETGHAATPYDFGAGSLNLAKAMDPGLVYDVNDADYVSYLCAIGYDVKTIQVITRVRVNCPRKKQLAENLNYPSISVVFGSSGLNGSKTVVRSVTNVGKKEDVVYSGKVEMGSGIGGVGISVRPSVLSFSKSVRKLSFSVTVTAKEPLSKVTYGYVVWSDEEHVVRSPIVVSWVEPM